MKQRNIAITIYNNIIDEFIPVPYQNKSGFIKYTNIADK